MSINRASSGYIQFLDSSGEPVAAGTVEFCVNNDPNTQVTVYSDAALTTPTTNPYTLSANGEIVGDVFLTGTYTIVLKDSSGNTLRQVNDLEASTASTTATTTTEGIIELATTAEVVAGIDTTRAVTSAGLTAKMSEPGPIGDTTPNTGAFTSVSMTGTLTVDTINEYTTANGVDIESVNLKDGNVVFGNGNGIDFSATSDATGSSSELFDDYEEGTFTPFIADSTSLDDNEGQTYSSQVGRYVKQGRMVHFTIFIAWTAIGTMNTSGDAWIGGLPYSAAQDALANVGGDCTIDLDDGAAITGWIDATYSTGIKLEAWGVDAAGAASTAGTGAVKVNNGTFPSLGTAGSLFLQGSYEV